MPIYEYFCSSCENEVEIVHGMSEKPKSKCPNCGGKLKRMISRNAFHLKGGGWYKDGYTNTGKGGSAGATKKPAGEKSPSKSAESSTAVA